MPSRRLRRRPRRRLPARRPRAIRAPERAEAVFAGGCFWCVEAVFRQLDGVLDVTSGYAGGTAETANYEAVSTGRTGHAEAVKIVYDPRKISYEKLLAVHFATHDPTSLNRQGRDIGTQYRSAIFYADKEQKRLAEAMIADLGKAKVYQAADRDDLGAADGLLSRRGPSSELSSPAISISLTCKRWRCRRSESAGEVQGPGETSARGNVQA